MTYIIISIYVIKIQQGWNVLLNNPDYIEKSHIEYISKTDCDYNLVLF